MKRLNYEIGAYGESLAKNFLRDQGYYILEENFSCKIGEIDLIARDENYICFIEVKTRYSQDYGTPAESITYRKRKKLYKIAHQSNACIHNKKKIIKITFYNNN